MRKKHWRQGITLIELLIVIAIIGIVAGIIVVALSGFRSRGRSAKAQAVLSSVIPSVLSCWGNGGQVRSPESGNNICSINGYGAWPIIGSDLQGGNYQYDSLPSEQHISGDKKSDWYFSMSSDDKNDNLTICCNSKMLGCGIIRPPKDCKISQTW